MRRLAKTLLLGGIAAAITLVLRHLGSQQKVAPRAAVETWENEGGALPSDNVMNEGLLRSP